MVGRRPFPKAPEHPTLEPEIHTNVGLHIPHAREGGRHLEDPDEDAWTLRTLTRAPGPDALFD